ncbi:VIP peptides [Gracilinanus agilis]|uniref:VIP peptides n=1 Tax=Gracilinanus agilis TaxID=191870 RepID=UPI001CFE0C06|nr:VIP peptides [Gracilinanus agilis]
MEARSSPQLLVSLMFLSVLCSQTLALPFGTYSIMSRLGNGLLFDGPNEPDQNLGFLRVENDNLESSLPENDLSFFDASRPMNRNSRHADGLFTSDYSKLLSQLSAKKYLESIIGKRVSDNLEKGNSLLKRHSDAVFTDGYTRLLKQMAMRKYLDSILNGKRSDEDLLKSENAEVNDPNSLA